MIRAPIGDIEYWDNRISQDIRWLDKAEKAMSTPAKNQTIEPQFILGRSIDTLRLLLRKYSRGDAIKELPQYFEGILRCWERSNELVEKFRVEQNLEIFRSGMSGFDNLQYYNHCFWLIGLALALEIPDEQWQRLLKLVNCEGQDKLLDKVIASREPGRKIGENLLHPKPYARLLKAIEAPKEQQAQLLKEFVENWYRELKRKGDKELGWYSFGDLEKQPLSMGNYFGLWCIEAVAAVKAFGLDDSQCLGLENYPGDLLRPDGPTTHPYRAELEQENKSAKKTKRGILAKLFGLK